MTYALTVDPNARLLSGAVDLNPAKIGKFLPVTALPVDGPWALPANATIIVMNLNYHAEIAAQIRSLGKPITLLDLKGNLVAV